MIEKIIFAVIVGFGVGFAGHLVISWIKHPKRIGRPKFRSLNDVLTYYGYKKS